MSSLSPINDRLFIDECSKTIRKEIFSQCSLTDLYAGSAVCIVWQQNISEVLHDRSQHIHTFFNRQVTMMTLSTEKSSTRFIWKNLIIASSFLNALAHSRLKNFTEGLDPHRPANPDNERNDYDEEGESEVHNGTYMTALILQNGNTNALSYHSDDQEQTSRFRNSIDFFVYG